MKIDVASYVGAVTREVAMRDHQGSPARVVVATRVYNAPADDVWDALTNAERIPRWFLPVSGDLRLGGRYQLKGNAGGEITGCEPPRKLALTWEFGASVTWVTVSLSDAPRGRTELTLEHIAHVGDEHWDQFGPGAVGVGWDLSLLGLDRHLTTGATVDHRQFEAWSSSGEGKAFMKGSSDDWCRASIAAGTDPAAARAAADRTTASYTGGSEPAADS